LRDDVFVSRTPGRGESEMLRDAMGVERRVGRTDVHAVQDGEGA
jgi:hypothetical protein